MDPDAVVFLPGDMPAVDPATVQQLIDAYRAGLGTALAAAFDGRRGNPGCSIDSTSTRFSPSATMSAVVPS